MMILVIDDHPMFAEILQFFLQQRPDLGELIHAEDAAATFDLLDTGLRPELILLDLHLPGINGLSLLRELQGRGITAPTLVVSASQSPHDMRSAMEQGARGFVSKTGDTAALLDAIDTVRRGELYLPPQWSAPSGTEVCSRGEVVRELTDRQTEILHLVAQGYANKKIAHMLGLSENTIKVHLREAYKALKVTNRTAFVREAERLGYL